MSTESDISDRVKVIENVILGPKGHPEESLVVTVENIAKSIRTLGRFIWAMSLTGGGLIVKEMLALITHAG